MLRNKKAVQLIELHGFLVIILLSLTAFLSTLFDFFKVSILDVVILLGVLL